MIPAYLILSFIFFILTVIVLRQKYEYQKWGNGLRGCVTILLSVAWPIIIIFIIVHLVGFLSKRQNWHKS